MSVTTVTTMPVRSPVRSWVPLAAALVWEAIRKYTGPDMERAQYFAYDLACLVEPELSVAHYTVVTNPSK